jgi:DNA-binding SARP family transcriptional activator
MVESASPSNQWRLTLFGGFRLSDRSGPQTVPRAAQRILAFLALGGPRDRRYVANMLWPDGTEAHALGSLRSALWRLGDERTNIVCADDTTLAVHPQLFVDVHQFHQCATALSDGLTVQLDHAKVTLATPPLLPGWYDDWVLIAEERIRQRRLHALEMLADRYAAMGSFAAALDAAYLAIATEPLRESAHRAVIRIHLAEGNLDEAAKHFDRFVAKLATEVGIPPTQQLRSLVAHLVSHGGARLERSVATGVNATHQTVARGWGTD